MTLARCPRRLTLPPSLNAAPSPASAARALLGAAALAALLAGCAGSVSPPAHLYQLRADPPASLAAGAPAAGNVVWQLGRVQLPAYLDRDTLLVPTGQAGLQPLSGHRWAEPLRDAVPRLLRQDLARLLGPDKVWGQPLPPGVQLTGQLLVELQRLDASAAGDAVVLQARWTLVDPAGKAAPVVTEAELRAAIVRDPGPASGVAGAGTPAPERLVNAHREVLWQLAQRIAASAPPR
ncbi:MAG TPA: PqiC family protein [Ideonella sp.]|nr:PqiC family protein [Ideonella sp.]